MSKRLPCQLPSIRSPIVNGILQGACAAEPPSRTDFPVSKRLLCLVAAPVSNRLPCQLPSISCSIIGKILHGDCAVAPRRRSDFRVPKRLLCYLRFSGLRQRDITRSLCSKRKTTGSLGRGAPKSNRCPCHLTHGAAARRCQTDFRAISRRYGVTLYKAYC